MFLPDGIVCITYCVKAASDPPDRPALTRLLKHLYKAMEKLDLEEPRGVSWEELLPVERRWYVEVLAELLSPVLYATAALEELARLPQQNR